MEQTEKARRLEFHISYQCLNRCLFCSEGSQLAKFKGEFVAKEKIRERLSWFAKKGFNHVTLTGGEPTLHPDFVEIARLARQMDYKTYVSSNGGLFSSKRFCQKTIPYLNEICFSLHGHNARLHNFHTRNKKSFGRLTRAMKNVEDLSKNVYGFVNIVLTQYNFSFLEKIIDFASQYKWIKQVLVSNLAPEGRALSNFRRLALPLNKIENKISQVVNLAENKSLIVRFFGLPLCLMGNYRAFSNDIYWPPRATIEKWQPKKKVYLKTTFSYQPTRQRIKLSQCKKCRAGKMCGGIFQKYYEDFGDKELKPF
jgi:MoaA/NifB/PqqE/SkfB family radical SAM enzyme